MATLRIVVSEATNKLISPVALKKEQLPLFLGGLQHLAQGLRSKPSPRILARKLLRQTGRNLISQIAAEGPDVLADHIGVPVPRQTVKRALGVAPQHIEQRVLQLSMHVHKGAVNVEVKEGVDDIGDCKVEVVLRAVMDERVRIIKRVKISRDLFASKRLGYVLAPAKNCL